MSVCFCEDGHYYATVTDEDGRCVPDPNQRLRWEPSSNSFVPAGPDTLPHNEIYEGKVLPVPAEPILGG